MVKEKSVKLVRKITYEIKDQNRQSGIIEAVAEETVDLNRKCERREIMRAMAENQLLHGMFDPDSMEILVSEMKDVVRTMRDKFRS